MSNQRSLSYVEVVEALVTRPAWALVDGRLVREHTIASWDEAFACLAPIAEHATRLDHHPDWAQRGRTLRFELVTHSAKGITLLDFALADVIDAELGKAL